MKELLNKRKNLYFFIMLFLITTAYFYLAVHNVPFWDDDFRWIHGRTGVVDFNSKPSVLKHFFDILWPISTESHNWGFLDRPVQKLLYALSFYIGGYSPFLIGFLKSIVCGLLACFLFFLSLKLTKEKVLSLLITVLFVTTPNLMASHVWYSDFEVFALLATIILLYILFQKIEETPKNFEGKPDYSLPVVKNWLSVWYRLCFVVYLSYQIKGDLRIIPFIVTAYVFLTRPQQIRFFMYPLLIMFGSSIPWGTGIFTHLPAWFPGGAKVENWMYSSFSLSHLFDYFALPVQEWTTAYPLSVLMILFPLAFFVPLSLILYLYNNEDKIEKDIKLLSFFSRRKERFFLFILLWFACVCLMSCMLPVINHFYRIRYTIILLLPFMFILAVCIKYSLSFISRKWIQIALFFVFFLPSIFINLKHSLNYRNDFVRQASLIDEAGKFIKTMQEETSFEIVRMGVLDFLYPSIPQKTLQIKNISELLTRKKDSTYLLTYQKITNDLRFDVIKKVTSCKKDVWGSCDKPFAIYLYKWVGDVAGVNDALNFMQEKNYPKAVQAFRDISIRYPQIPWLHFQMGTASYFIQDYLGMNYSFHLLHELFPDWSSVHYNYALSLRLLGRKREAAENFEELIAKDPKISSYYTHLYEMYQEQGFLQKAAEIKKRQAAVR